MLFHVYDRALCLFNDAQFLLIPFKVLAFRHPPGFKLAPLLDHNSYNIATFFLQRHLTIILHDFHWHATPI